MRYVKPEIAVLASANVAIQGTPPQKTLTLGFDNINDQSPYVTNGAYEADE